MERLEMNHVSKCFKHVNALDDVSLRLEKGECLGVLGESGSGKSTLAKLLLGIDTATCGQILMDGKPLNLKKRDTVRNFRKEVQMVFQDATSSLNPKLPLWKSILEPLSNFKEITPSYMKHEKSGEKETAADLLSLFGMEREMIERYPDELSGGQKQRAVVARALSIEPSFLVCDEPTSSLDVTVQLDLLHLLKEKQQEQRMGLLFISHDVKAVVFLCDRIVVMKNGKVVDECKRSELYSEDRHPYTKALIKAAR
ncbi:ABC transporter ATP-binding protein (plasmid) [Pseudalkalibacillus hwajinpoensis]|uniref:ABC transporter ATP-binding protein n=1 Tax=Guptibacillus hwajinpoensis TaxID=208199 RepID=UPI00325A9E5C